MRKIVYLIALFCTSFFYAQTSGITYQAVIYYPNGQNIPGVDIQKSPMANKSVCLQFSLTDDLSQLEYQEVIQTTTDEFGMVNLIIGSGNQTGGYVSSFNAIVWNANTKVLKVQLDVNGTCQQFVVLSDNPLSAVPFAYAAVTANNVSGVVQIQNGGTGATNLVDAKINLQIDNVDNTSDSNKPISIATQAALDTKENTANKSITTTLGTSDILFPTQNAVKSYVDTNITTINASNTALQATVTANATAATTAIAAVQADVDANEIASNTALALKENTANKSATTTLGTSDVLFPTQNAVKTYVDTNISTVNDNNTTLQAVVTSNATAATTAIAAVQADVDANEIASNTALALKENTANKSATTTLGTSDVLFPTQNAVKSYVDTNITTINASNTALQATVTANASSATTAIAAVQADVDANETATNTALALKENTANKSATTTLGTSDVLFPTQNAVKTYIDTNISTVNTNNTALQATVTANATAATTAIAAVQADVDANEIASNTALALKENTANKSATTTLGTSDVLFPTQNAVKTYVDAQVASATIADADASTKGKIQLAGDLGGTAAFPTVPGLTNKENTANKSATTTLGTSDVLFPTQNAVKTYVDTNITTVNANNTALQATVTANASSATTAIAAVQADVDANEIASNNALALKEDAANKSTTTTLGTSDVLFPTQNAVKTYVDAQVASATIADADASTKGKIKLAGDLGGTADLPTVPGLTNKENTANKSATTTLGTSDVLFPTQNAVKTYVDTNITTVNANNTALQATVTANASSATTAIAAVQADVDANEIAANNAIAIKEDSANKTLDLTTVDGTSNIKFPSAKATKDYVDSQIATGVVDATTTVKGKVQLAGDLTGIATAPEVAAGKITTTKLANDAVTTAKITDANVTYSKIQDITNDKVLGNFSGSTGVVQELATTGSGDVVRATSPTLVTPDLGTPSAAVLTNASGLSLTTGITGILPVANGGTGSATQNYVDLTSNQTIGGVKQFTSNATFNGQSIGKGNATGGENLAVGSGAMNAVSTGVRNTAIGNSAMQNYVGTSFDNNTSVGYANLVGLTTGSGNTSVGAESMMALTTGTSNTSIGNQSLINTTGSNNVGVGKSSGNLNSTGNNNTIIGTEANLSANNLNNASALGYGATVASSNTIQLGNTDVTSVKTSGAITTGGMTYPNTVGTANQVLTTDGIGLSTWQTLIGFNKDVEKVNFGMNTGFGNQANLTTAVGAYAGQQDQGLGATALGRNAGNTGQGAGSVAVGQAAGATNQGSQAVAIGNAAGASDQGTKSIAIGELAGYANQHANSIILNATGNPLNSDNANALYIAPIRSATNTNVLLYNPTTKEVTTSANIPGTATNVSGTVAIANGGTGATSASDALTNIGAQAISNLSTDLDMDNASLTKYPAVKTIKDYVDSSVTSGAPDATATVKGKLKLAGDITGTADLPRIAADAVTTAKILNANVTNAKLATGIDATKLADGSVTNTELQYIGTLASDAQTQIDALSTAGTTNTSAITAINTLDNGKIYLGNASNVATEVTPTGDVTITNAGVTAIGTNKVVTAMLADDAVTTAKIKNDAIITSKITDENVTYAKIQNVSDTNKVLGRVSSGAGVIEEITTTGSGDVVRATSPTLVTPALGTPSAAVLTNATGLPLTSGVTGTLPVANGGTGVTSIAANSVVLGNGTGAIQTVAPGTSGNILTSDGTTWQSSAPTAGTMTGTAAAGQVTYFTGTSTTAGSSKFLWDNTNSLFKLGPGYDTSNAESGFNGSGGNYTYPTNPVVGIYGDVASSTENTLLRLKRAHNQGSSYQAVADFVMSGARTKLNIRLNNAGDDDFVDALTLTNTANGSAPLIGINKTSPTTTLDVAGTAAVSGNTTIGGTLGVTNAVTLDNLTASKAVFTDSSKVLTSTGVLGLDQGGLGLSSVAAGRIPFGDSTMALNTSSKFLFDNTNSLFKVGPGYDSSNAESGFYGSGGAYTYDSSPVLGVYGGPASATESTLLRLKRVHNQGTSYQAVADFVMSGARTKMTIRLNNEGDNDYVNALTLTNNVGGTLPLVGINKLTPTATLDVAGTAAVSGNTTVGGTLDVTGALTSSSGITGTQLTSTVATGTAPLVVTSTTPVTNLNIGGNAATATKLATARKINTVDFDGTTDITVTSAAGTLTGTTLASNVVSSSLTSVGTIATGTWNGTTIAIANGGTGQTTKTAAFDALSPMTTAGDIIYGGTSGSGTRLAKGIDGQVLVLAAGVPKWSNNIGGGVLSKTDSYDILATDSANLLVYSGSATSKTIKLPSAVTVGAGREITIKNIASVSVSIAAVAGNLISDSTTTGATTLSIGVEPSNNWIKAISDGTNWIILRALF